MVVDVNSSSTFSSNANVIDIVKGTRNEAGHEAITVTKEKRRRGIHDKEEEREWV
jgi:hypothetical protein